MLVGIQVNCTVCKRMKQPRGRSAPIGSCYCNREVCHGYGLPPWPGDLWPGETEEDFGYPVSKHATKECARAGSGKGVEE